jgi:tetratricopeptide (TPR) repeat protein
MIQDFPLTGTGLGSYIHIYPSYRSISADEIVDHAHNDYLELLSEGGLVAGVIVIWFLVDVLRKTYRVFIRRQEPYAALLYVGSVTGIFSILVHSVTDFNLHIGANALYFFFLAGLAVSAAHTRMKEGLNDTFLRKSVPVSNIVLIAAIAVLFVSTSLNAGGLMAQYTLSSMKRLTPDVHMSREELQAMKTGAYRASFLDPLNASSHKAAATADWMLSNRDNALEEYRTAIRRDPVNGHLLQTFGLAMSRHGRDEKAEGLLRGGIRCDGSSPVRYKTYALWLISKGRMEESIGHFRKAISLEPEKTRDYVALLVLSGWTDEQIQGALPDRVIPHILFAEYLLQTGMESLAAAEYLSAFAYIGNEKKIVAAPFYQASRYFVKKGLFEDALKIMRKAEESLPRDVGIKMTVAEIYEKTGIQHRAMEQYKKILMIEPGNSMAKKKLEEFR